MAAVPVARLPAQVPPADGDLLQRARDQVRRNAAELAKQQVSMATEPAFVFKA
jgi:hypothetical protein